MRGVGLPAQAKTVVVGACTLYGLTGGLVSLIGWLFDLPLLTHWDGDAISIQPNASLAAVAVGAALLLFAFGRTSAAAVIAVGVTALGALTAIENVADVDFGIDRALLFARNWGTAATTAPGRMGLPASVSWALLGAGLYSMSARPAARFRSAAPWLAVLPLASSTLSILGYVYDSSRLYAMPGVTAIALQTATYVFALAVALIVSAENGPMKVFGDPGPAGIAARRLLPFVFAIPVLTGAVRLAGERMGLYDTAFGVALHNLVEIALLLVLLWWTGRAVMRHSEQARQAEAERRELLVLEQTARREAERQATIRDEFLAMLSHELRTPLNAILGWAQILKTDIADSSRIGQAAEVIERNARLQAQMIAELLDLSRILAGKMRLHVQPVDLEAVVSAAVETIQPAADAKKIRIQRVLEPLGSIVNGDPSRLQQVVWNLLSNAVKFTPRDGKVQIVLARVNSHVEIRVSDSGQGIDADFLPKVFELFMQADASTARMHGGLGLGLALVRQLVELHGGKVTVASEGRDRGAAFTVSLPLAMFDPRTAEQRVHPLAPELRPATAPLPRLDGLSVLVVDDSVDSLQMIAELFEGRGAAVTTAASAAVALELAGTRRFDAIVSDIGMPGRDGYELMKDLRALGVKTPAVALTAFARSEDRTKALSSGYQSHVAKPVEAAELLATVMALAPQAPG
jgi:signal transduction histidine kinase